MVGLVSLWRGGAGEPNSVQGRSGLTLRFGASAFRGGVMRASRRRFCKPERVQLELMTQMDLGFWCMCSSQDHLR